jgi:leader peptidase (prepilin peptidase)/N-methyltransferase
MNSELDKYPYIIYCLFHGVKSMPLVEIISAVVFFMYMGVSSVFDMKFMRINGNIAVILGICTLCLVFFSHQTAFVEKIVTSFGLVAVLLVVNYFKKEAIGSGDIKSLFYMAVVLGFWGVWLALLFGCATLLVFYLPRLIRKKIDSRSKIAFMPFLTIGSMVSFIALEMVK